ncbi:MAG TPA: arginine--tRNA ligase [Nitriliruptorales bacterium]|nr:arginine--tRNA ligase [Nitriliruptorales bacterium]
MVRPQDIDPVLATLDQRIRAALAGAGLPVVDPIPLERPRHPEHGDWATPVALGLAGDARLAPRAVADRLVRHLDVPEVVGVVEVAGPGFVNFRLTHAYFEDVIRRILAAGDRYGRRTRPAHTVERVNVEFVSANPTGPLHVGNGRWAAAGDSIAALLEADGHEVVREYYFNDAGSQMTRLGGSVLRAARGEPPAEQDYRGDYVRELGAEIVGTLGDAFLSGPNEHEVIERVAGVAGQRMIERIRALLHRLGVDFDVWFSERHLHERGDIQATVEALSRSGHTDHRDGALWLRTTAFGDDKDRVLIRSDGRPTYVAADCAYLRDKLRRGFDRLVYLVGADHHGWSETMSYVVHAFDVDPDAVEILVGQFVHLVRAGQPVRMSKRAGDYVTLDELVDEVGVDVARYHFLRAGLDQSIDFDLEAVVRQSMENPVFYVQYAHARIASILRNADESGFDHGHVDDAALDLLTEPTEEELLRRLAEFPEVVAEAAELRAPHRMTRYAEDLAGSFHRFYTECRVLGVREDIGQARYWLAVAAKQVLVNALGLLRVPAPERM